MKTIGQLLILGIIIIIFSNFRCKEEDKEAQKQQIKQETEKLLIGTWRAWYGIQPCKYAQITFNADGTGKFTYLGENDSLIIDPPCDVTWYVYADEYKVWGGPVIKPFLSVIRLEKKCVGCERRWTDPPDTTIYLIDYINENSMKVFFWGGSKMTTYDLLGCDGGSIFLLPSNELYKQK